MYCKFCPRCSRYPRNTWDLLTTETPIICWVWWVQRKQRRTNSYLSWYSFLLFSFSLITFPFGTGTLLFHFYFVLFYPILLYFTLLYFNFYLTVACWEMKSQCPRLLQWDGNNGIHGIDGSSVLSFPFNWFCFISFHFLYFITIF